jgi:integrase
VLNVAEERYPALYPILLGAVHTGLRQGELIGLQWGDVDLHGRVIHVRRSVVLRQETTTKNHKIRRLDLSQQFAAVLQRLKEVRQLEAMNESREMLPWVFLSPRDVGETSATYAGDGMLCWMRLRFAACASMTPAYLRFAADRAGRASQVNPRADGP